MQANYVLSRSTDPQNVPVADADRATALGCSLLIGDPTGLVTVYPSVVVRSTVLAPVVIADDTGQATLAEVQSASSLATTAETAKASAIVAATANLQALVTQLAPSIAQGQLDLTTLAASSDVLAPIISRILQGTLTLAQGVSDILTSLEIISS